MQILLAIALLVQPLFVPSSHASAWCSKVDRYLDDVKKNEEYSLDQILDENPDVVLFGEIHNDWTSQDIFMQMAGEFMKKDRDFDCLFLEMPEELDQDAMDDWLDRKISYETLGQRYCDLVKPSSLAACERRVSIWYSPYFKKKLETARDLGLQVYYMDATHDPYFMPADWRSKLPQWMYTVGMVERNSIMARNIAMRIGRKQCNKAFVIVGSAHNTEKTKKDVPIRSISDHLKPFGYHGIPINFYSTKVDPREDNYFYYSPLYMTEKECGRTLPTGKIYHLPYDGTNMKTSPQELAMDKWVYDAVPSLKDRPFGSYEFVYLHDCPECSKKPFSKHFGTGKIVTGPVR